MWWSTCDWYCDCALVGVLSSEKRQQKRGGADSAGFGQNPTRNAALCGALWRREICKYDCGRAGIWIPKLVISPGLLASDWSTQTGKPPSICQFKGVVTWSLIWLISRSLEVSDVHKYGKIFWKVFTRESDMNNAPMFLLAALIVRDRSKLETCAVRCGYGLEKFSFL